MTEQITRTPEQEIIQSICGDAEAQVSRLIGNGESAAATELEKGRKEVEEVRREILGKAEATGARQRAREVAAAKMEAKRLLLAAREDAVSEAFRRVRVTLEQICADPERRRESLKHLAVEAVVALNEPRVRLRVDRADEKLADAAFVDFVKQEAAKSLGIGSAVDVVLEFSDVGGGCVAESLNRRVVFNNTYAKRFERVQRELRARVIKEMTKHHG